MPLGMAVIITIPLKQQLKDRTKSGIESNTPENDMYTKFVKSDSWKKTLIATMLAVPLDAAVKAVVPEVGLIGVAHAQDTLEEVLVTARKRGESLADVPVAISALQGLEIERQGISNVEDLMGKVPGISFSQNNNVGPQKDQKAIVLRGVGFNPVLEPSTGVFVDGIYQPGVGFDIEFLDVERVEVLRGPQGTLFGRNTEAGAISIITRKPAEQASGRVMLEVDDFNSARGLLSVSGPLSGEAVSGSLVLKGGFTDGYIDNATTGGDQDDTDDFGARAQLHFAPGENFEANFSVDYSRLEGGVVGAGIPDNAGESYVVFDDTNADQEQENLGVSLSMEWQFESFALTSLTGYRDSRSDLLADVDSSSIATGNFQAIDVETSVTSQELRISSNQDGPLHWLAGVYWFEEEFDQALQTELPDLAATPLAAAQGFIVDNTMTADREGLAFFGQMSYRMLEDKLELTFGARWSEEEVDATRDHFTAIDFSALGLGPIIFPLPGGVFTESVSTDFDNVSTTLSVSYDVSEDIMIYASVAEGFKAGGFNKFPSFVQPYLPIDSETTLNKEVGIKGSFFDNKATIAAALYDIDIDDMQLFTLVTDPVTGLPASAISSAGESSSQGGELEMTILPTENLRISLALAYTDTEFNDFVDVDGVDRSGQEFPYVPELTGALNVDYETTISNGWKMRLAGGYSFVGDHHAGLGTSQDPRFDIDSYGIADFEVSILSEDQGWELALFIRNAFDEYAVVNHFPSISLDYPSLITVLPPQRFGVRANFSW